MTTVVTQLGVRTHYSVPRILHSVGQLEMLYTDIYMGNKPCLQRKIRGINSHFKIGALSSLYQRDAADLPACKISSFDMLGVWQHYQQWSQKLNIWQLYNELGSRFGNLVVSKGYGAAESVYGFDGASKVIFEDAKEKELQLFLDQTIVPYGIIKKEMDEEYKNWPHWENPTAQPNSTEIEGAIDKLAKNNKAEWALADKIFCGSRYVADCVADQGGPADKCHVVPYGFERPDNLPQLRRKTAPNGRPARLIFVGGVGLRKGIPYLLEALATLKFGEVETRIIGQNLIAPEKLNSYRQYATFTGPLTKPELYKQYEWADALVLPSLCEGSAMVTHEAQQFGLAVIVTPNAGADVIEGVTGLTVPARNVQALVEAIRKLPDLLDNPARRENEALKQGSFERYRERLLGALFHA